MESGQKSILIVEDEPKLAEVLAEYMQQAGFKTHWISHGLEVIPWVKEHKPDLLTLDLMLPGRDGIDIFRELRSFSLIPVIMATARVDEIDRLLGLELGADDYVCKPYSPREMIARTKNILRRIARPLQEQASESVIQIDNERMEARLNGIRLDLTPVEFRLLHQFFSNPGRVYSRTQLLDCIYDDYRIVTDRAIDSHIKNLRRKLHEAMPDQEFIKSIYGVGYKLEFL
ncbi:MAG: response regulator [Gammaproteobacteria bacterium]|nr:response regulator [Gammaproteobacteria bacterium]MBU1725018.1 response regulator [Gammaproteobacteria bacterium]MBU2003888.1 response regulator [Gammaproteobacteria bacterium]